jgi:hypothetical protein
MKVWGYFDASGTHDNLDSQGRPSPAVSVAGYLATPKQWEQFDKDWKQRLDKDNLPYFHMAEFVAQGGLFKKRNEWPKERRDALIQDLIKIIGYNMTYGLGMVVFRADYDRVIAREPQVATVLGSPYAFCSFRCFESAVDWARRAKYRESIKYVFESGDGFKHQVQDTHTFICNQDSLREFYKFSGSLTFDDGVKTRPLQAADILAWELNKELYRRLYPDEKRPYTRNSLTVLMEIPGDYKEYTEADLTGYLQDFVEKRGRFLVVVPSKFSRRVI